MAARMLPGLAVVLLLALCRPAFAVAAEPAGGDTLREIRARGYVTCGFHMGIPGFAAIDESGEVKGLLVDFCRALAAATLGDARAFRSKALPDKPQEMSAVANGEVDVAVSNATWTMGREVGFPIAFVQPIFYDGQGFAVWTRSARLPLRSLDDQTVCVKASTTTLPNLQDLIAETRRHWTVHVFKTWEEALQAFLAHDCNMLTTDRSVLLTALIPWREGSGDLLVYPDVISREPLTPYVRFGDRNWQEIVRWTIFATIRAEQKGIDAANVRSIAAGEDAETDRLLGKSGNLGRFLGLSPGWAFDVISQVGNYGDIFERNLGKGSRVGMERGLNDLAKRGGLLYSPPFQ